ncbi:FadR/GntR family transcriptional regulator [Nonomuraea angiospora]|uniref:DNA-binding FadR family transcriptional regulator n=1 Tax=Nonomuraea angiospora TaxID=46172 RepID=A0ABR9LWU7_9ACTN|nr:FCD domain-containing protein [Nonomuraea angiospora]MBE1585128.1 DNA-binding FadR family transcriptional regulator [Nonomuraea angiospora]
MPLGSLRPSPLVEQATQHLREQITQGEWPVGTRLPGENALAKALGVGRSTVREALRALAGAGLVQARQGSGVFVIATATATVPAEDWPARLRRAAITDVYEVRMMVETQAARMAARRRTEEDVAALEEALAARARAAAQDDAAFVDADIALHAAVVAAAGNPVLTDLFAEFAPALREGLIGLVEVLGLRAHDRNPGHDSHAELVAAVRDGDGDAAGAILQAELEQTLAHLHGA